ncbi:UDP-N-acetyl glucosamine 2-epimerase [Spirochaetia bacterium]|nr:UDP-N-acetyl glucosamine 2-epimerase [Spirochaetia bacterium]
MKKRILLIFGTRPEAIKMALLVKLFKQETCFTTKVCVTAQHRQMLDQVLDFFDIRPDYDLDLMRPNQDLFSLTSEIISKLKPILIDYHPDFVFVHGDTTTSTCAALASFYAGCKICHVEAGLRTNNKFAPYPEEMNRQLTGRLADLHFSPTNAAKENLIKENIQSDTIFVTGNTVIDALLYSVDKLNKENDTIIFDNIESVCDPGKDIILVTGHRRENFGDGFVNICQALRTIAENDAKIQIIYPVHFNPNVRKPVLDILGGIDNIQLIDPLDYPSFVWLMNKSKLIITDSGGVQEEAPSLGKPVLVMRETTERPEAVKAGTVILVGTDKDKIISKTLELLNNEKLYESMSAINNPYGDGTACQQIINIMKGKTNE